MTSYRTWAFVFLCVLAWQPRSLHGQTLYANASGQLITIDTTTGAGTLVGPTVGSWGTGFRGNKLYTWDAGADRLREIDVATGATLNTIDIGLSAPLGGDLTFRADGIGFIAQYVPTQLVQFDLTVPNSAPVGPLAQSMFGLAFSPTGILYGLASGGATLHTIDPATGVVTLIGNTGLSAIPNGALACDASGNLFATLTTPGVGTFLYRLDPSTGVATSIGNVGFSPIGGITFSPPAPPPPPPPPPPLPLPSPPPPPNGNEGSYRGSGGPRGAEGTFGFGGGQLDLTALRRPFLTSPHARTDATMVVFNVAHQRNTDCAQTTEPGFPGVLLSGIALLLGGCGFAMRWWKG